MEFYLRDVETSPGMDKSIRVLKKQIGLKSNWGQGCRVHS